LYVQNPKAAEMKRIFTCNVPEDENNLVQTRLGGEFWARDVSCIKPIGCQVKCHGVFRRKTKVLTKNMAKTTTTTTITATTTKSPVTHEGENLIKQSFQSRL